MLYLFMQQVLFVVKQVLFYLWSIVENFGQLGRSVGLFFLQFFLDFFRCLVVYCEQLDVQNQQRCEVVWVEVDFFLDMEFVVLLELVNDQMLEEVFVVIFRYFILEGWFLVLEQQVFLLYMFSFVFVKFLVIYFSVGVFQLLVVSVLIFQNIGQLGFLVRYLEVIIQSVLKEFQNRRVGLVILLLKILLQLEVLQELYLYMEGVQFCEVILVLLSLFEIYLVIQ